MISNQFELDVLVDDKPVRQFSKEGRAYIQGNLGKNFTLRFRNNTFWRVLVVPSIDGVSTLDGKPATPDSPGYVVHGQSTCNIKGWRTSLADVSKFVFEDKKASYAVKGGTGEANCGVIGVIVFAEKQASFTPFTTTGWPPLTANPIWYQASTTTNCLEQPTCVFSTSTTGLGSAAASNAGTYTVKGSGVLRSANMTSMHAGGHWQAAAKAESAEAPDFKLGTGWGEKTEDKVTSTTFERDGQLMVFNYYYTTGEALKAIGIDVDKKSSVALPQAFSGFCQPPK